MMGVLEMRDGPKDTFEDRFGDYAAAMLRALERRRDRAMHRAGSLHRHEWEGGMDGERWAEHARWLDVRADYQRAHDGVHKALVFVRHAAELLRQIREAQGKRRGQD